MEPITDRSPLDTARSYASTLRYDPYLPHRVLSSTRTIIAFCVNHLAHVNNEMFGTPAVILLSFVLAAGFLLVILSCALWANWLPLLVGELTPEANWSTFHLIFGHGPPR